MLCLSDYTTNLLSSSKSSFSLIHCPFMDLERSSLSLIAQLLSVFFLSAKDLIQILHDRVQEESKNVPTKPPVNHSSPRPFTTPLGPISDLLQLKTPNPFLFFFPLSLSLSLPCCFPCTCIYIYIYILANQALHISKPFLSLPFLCPLLLLYSPSLSTNFPVSKETSQNSKAHQSYKLKQDPFTKPPQTKTKPPSFPLPSQKTNKKKN